MATFLLILTGFLGGAALTSSGGRILTHCFTIFHSFQAQGKSLAYKCVLKAQKRLPLSQVK